MTESTVSRDANAGWEPESERNFRLAQLLLLLEQAGLLRRDIPSVDRLGYYDFFAANPFIVTSDDYPHRERDRIILKRAGFLEGQLSYGQAGQRYVSRRERLREDVSVLLGWGLVAMNHKGYGLTAPGEALAENLSTVYADQYREAVRIVISRLGPLSNARLVATVQRWLGETWLLVDYLGDVDEAAASTSATANGIQIA
jgi:hypothetical protein